MKRWPHTTWQFKDTVTEMRVLHAFKVYKPHHGGIVTVIDQLAHAWPQVDSRILACISGSGFGQVSDDRGVLVRKAGSLGHLLSMPISLSYPFLFWAEARRADVVAYHYPFPLIDVAASVHFPARAGLVIHWHSEIVAQRSFARLLGPFVRRCLARADRIIVSTPGHIEISPSLQAVREKCEVVPFGVNPSEWRLEPGASDASQEHCEPFLLAVGRLVPYKGFDVLLHALALTDARLVIIGEGPEDERLRSLARELGIEKRVRFAGGSSREVLRALMNRCRAFLLPSVTASETFGIVQLEAMSCGKPVVNTDAHPGIGWIARNGMEALTVRAGDASALAWAMNKLWEDDGLVERLGANGARRVSDEFTQDRFMDRVRRIYEEVREARR